MTALFLLSNAVRNAYIVLYSVFAGLLIVLLCVIFAGRKENIKEDTEDADTDLDEFFEPADEEDVSETEHLLPAPEPAFDVSLSDEFPAPVPSGNEDIVQITAHSEGAGADTETSDTCLPENTTTHRFPCPPGYRLYIAATGSREVKILRVKNNPILIKYLREKYPVFLLISRPQKVKVEFDQVCT